MVCLFLFIAAHSFAQDFPFSANALKAYKKVLDLDVTKARAELKNSSPIGDQYVIAVSEAIDLLLTEDLEKFNQYESNFEKRTDRASGKTTDDLYFQAELHLQWVFVYLKFGHEFDAALHLRKSYWITRELRKKNPAYLPVLKTSGLLNVMIGSVPEKYNWILDLLDIQGDVMQGLNELQQFRQSSHPLAVEADLWYAFIHGFVLQKPEIGLDALEKLIISENRNITAQFLAANLYVKNSDSEKALGILNEIEKFPVDILVPYSAYLKGEILLQKGVYAKAIEAFDLFLQRNKGQNYVKDALYKTGICYLLEGNTSQAKLRFEQAKVTGSEAAEADKHASKALSQHELPSIELTKVRYFTDGGYYMEALTILNTLTLSSFTKTKDQIEFEYRKARLYHKMNDIPKAILAYINVIKINGSEEFYYAPNACLQLGYLSLSENKVDEAKRYFNQALSYKKHEYKNSIDSKARSALSQLKGRK
jgi:tetratricopeptide (TPR) repeat protein